MPDLVEAPAQNLTTIKTGVVEKQGEVQSTFSQPESKKVPQGEAFLDEIYAASRKEGGYLPEPSKALEYAYLVMLRAYPPITDPHRAGGSSMEMSRFFAETATLNLNVLLEEAGKSEKGYYDYGLAVAGATLEKYQNIVFLDLLGSFKKEWPDDFQNVHTLEEFQKKALDTGVEQSLGERVVNDLKSNTIGINNLSMISDLAIFRSMSLSRELCAAAIEKRPVDPALVDVVWRGRNNRKSILASQIVADSQGLVVAIGEEATMRVGPYIPPSSKE